MRVLLTGEGYTDLHFAALRAAGHETVHVPDLAPECVAEALQGIDIHVLGGSERLDATVLAKARALRLISFAGTGIGAFVDVAAAAAQGIALKTTPNTNTDAVAEHTLGLLLGLCRGLFAYNESAKRGAAEIVMIPQLADLTIGILGLGHIGARVAQLLAPFGPRLLYANRTSRPELEATTGLRQVEISSLFAAVDAVILLLASTDQTRGIVGKAQLSNDKPGTLLINTASADLVDPWALRHAIDAGGVAAAAFDGYWIEPLPAPADDPYGLLALSDARFVVTPHCAAKTPQSWGRMLDGAVANAAAYV
jgi:glyoxylate reductase